MKALNIGHYFMSYSHKYNKSICGMLPKRTPIINSIEVCAFITKREEATTVHYNSKKRNAKYFGIDNERLVKTNTVNALIPII
jgi:hypothetical protein